MSRRRTALFTWLVLAMVLAGTPAGAHDSRPLLVDIKAQGDGLFRAHIGVPPSVAAANRPTLDWPENCRPAGTNPTGADTSLVRCKNGLAGERIAVTYPGFNPSLTTLMRFTPTAGETVTSVLPPDRLSWTVAAAPGPLGVARNYFGLGVSHILAGIDHLLFVLGLMLLAGTARRILVAVTGFTAAHSITLSLAAVGLVNVPVPPVEAAIALSIVFLAAEIARGHTDGLAARYPLLIALVFGLLHGLGFAAALTEVGLPSSALPVALLFFNLGVEAGQVAFILGVLGALGLAAKLPRPRLPAGAATTAAAYALGIPAAFWVIERVSQF